MSATVWTPDQILGFVCFSSLLVCLLVCFIRACCPVHSECFCKSGLVKPRWFAGKVTILSYRYCIQIVISSNDCLKMVLVVSFISLLWYCFHIGEEYVLHIPSKTGQWDTKHWVTVLTSLPLTMSFSPSRYVLSPNALTHSLQHRTSWTVNATQKHLLSYNEEWQVKKPDII